MAVSIDTVYQRVLAIANKEQRGYITPQEFNLLANQTQLEIFEQYFYDINQLNRFHGNNTEYSDMLDNINEKLSPFQKYTQDVSVTAASIGTLPADVYRLGTLMYVGDTYPIEIEEVQPNELINLEKAPLTRATLTHPYYIRLTSTTVELYPSTLASSSKISDAVEAESAGSDNTLPVNDAIPSVPQVLTTGTIAVVATASAAATPFLLRIVKPLVKQVLTRVQKVLGKKVATPNLSQKRTNADREKKNLPPLKL